MEREQVDLVRGTLDMLVLKALVWGPMHGYDVMGWLSETSRGELDIEEGALYPALHRMEERDWVRAEWGLSENNRRAKYYVLTERGRRQLATQSKGWTRYVNVVARIMQTA